MIRLTRKHVIKAIVILLAIGIIIAGVFGALYYLSWKNVTFTLSSNTKSVTVYYANSEEGEARPPDSYIAASIDAPSTIRLRTGSYIAIPNGDMISSATIPFNVSGDMTIHIDPYFSDKYLSEAFTGELGSIHDAITAKYPVTANNYTLGDGRFYHFGDWYSTILYNSNPGPGDGVDVYGVILHKTNGSWEVSATPSIVFTYANNQSIPRDIIDLSNGLINDY